MDVKNLAKGVKNLSLNNKQETKLNTFVIYNKSFNNGNGSSSEVVANKSSKNRRRRRPRREIVKNHHNNHKLSQTLLSIESIIHHQKCIFVRHRSDKYRYVNIYSYLNDTRKTIIFTNQLCNDKKFNATTSLASSNKKFQNGMDIIKKRKYLNIHLQYQNSSSKKRKLETNKKYTAYLTSNNLQEALTKNELIEGALRINTKNFKEAYVSNADESEGDFLITSIQDRNRALDGDVVYLKLRPKEEWKENRKTASVVYIKEKVSACLSINDIYIYIILYSVVFRYIIVLLLVT